MVSLNVIGPHNLKESDTFRRCGFVGVRITVYRRKYLPVVVGFEVSFAQYTVQ